MEEYKKTGYLQSNFRLFHLIDDKRDKFQYHYHDFEKILIFLRGDVTYHIEGRIYPLGPYDIVLVRAGEVHKPVIEKKSVYERIILYISPEFLASYETEGADLTDCLKKSSEESSHVIRLPAFAREELMGLLKELEESFQRDDFANALYQKTKFLEFMIKLNRTLLDCSAQYMERKASNEKIVAVIDYLNDHLQDDFTIEQLADHFYLSKYYLMHRFKEETGYTIGSYVSTKRLLRARNLIREGALVTEACYECGFRNYSTFSRAYKKQFGVSAKKYKV